ncbi:MAG: HlyD family efflux transporter periplasmic adaptor subunit [Verrucomicrobiota bacterium]
MSAQTQQRGVKETESEMLPQDPPPKVMRLIAWLLIALFFSGMLAAFTIHLPETVHAPFILVPKDGADPIQSPRLAVVTKIGVVEGQEVKKGEALFVLRSDEIRGFSTDSRSYAQDLRTHEQSLAKADAAYKSQIEFKLAEISQAESEVKFREKHVTSSKELVDRMEKLSETGGISQVDLIRLRLDLAGSEKDLSVAQRTLQQVKLDKKRMEIEYSRKRGEEVAEMEKLKFRVSALKGDLVNSDQNLLSIRAPYDAVVISLTQRTVGNVVQSGQELCQLAPVKADPRARMILSETALPKLKASQRVRLFFEAFPYQRYGAVNAQLKWISPSAISSPDGPHFVGLASLDAPGPKERHKPLALAVGMRGDARIVVGRRTLIEYAFEPIRQLRENMSE